MDAVIDTRYGKLRGESKDGLTQFLGVPFAKPPVGDLRFRRPQPVDSWAGTRDALRYSNYSIQPGKAESAAKYATESEDCLYLNVFTPACDDAKRPVVVWIHGGAYLTGAGSSAIKQGGIMARDHGMVVVSIQYRLGALGCVDFSLLDGAQGRFDSNCGTWDQVAAVLWVVDNIEAFGGDPTCITLMGESAGACSVLTLMTTPYLKGKIRRAVLDSPAPLLINTTENGRIAAQDIAARLGVPEHEACRIADLPAEVLTQATYKSELNYLNHHPYLLPTAPVVDGDLIPELPFDAVMHGAADGIDLLIGTTRDEGTLFASGSVDPILPSNTEQLGRFFQDHPGIDAAAITSLYPGYPNKEAFQEIAKEIFFHLPSLAVADRMAKSSTVYMHRFDYVFPVLGLLGMGALHTANSALTAGIEPTGLLKALGLFSGRKGRAVSRLVHEAWCNFIVTGDPNGAGVPAWPADDEDRRTLFIDGESSVKCASFEREREAYGLIRPYGN